MDGGSRTSVKFLIFWWVSSSFLLFPSPSSLLGPLRQRFFPPTILRNLALPLFLLLHFPLACPGKLPFLAEALAQQSEFAL